jgi:rod shape-determining protein MreD
MKRIIAAAAALTAILLVQLTVVNGLALPRGGTPDLVLLCVVALGLTSGPAPGLIAGFCAGLALDLAPPANQLIGQYALVLCLVGYWSGRLRFTLRHSAVLALVAAAVMAAVGETMAAALTLILDPQEVSWETVARVLPASVLYDAMLGSVVLVCWVWCAVALGASFDPHGDSPALETGGSAAQVTHVVGTALPGRPMPGQAGQRLAIGGDRRAAASGRWLVGDVAEAAPAVGALGWLGGPVRSRRARRKQARLTALVTGASAHEGAFWVGRRPPGLVPGRPPAPRKPRGLGRLRPGSGVPGTAAMPPRQAPALVPGPVHLGLADQQRRRARAALRAGVRANTRQAHGVDAHGVRGPGVASIAFGGSGVTPPGLHQGRDLPRIAFGTGSLAGAGRAAGRQVPRIAFGTGSLAGAGRAAGRQVPRIAFGTGSLPGAGRAAGRQVPRIAFGTGSLPGAGRAVRRGVPTIAFGARGGAPGELGAVSRAGPGRARDGWIGQGQLGASVRGVPALRFVTRKPGVTRRRTRPAAPRFASGQWLAGSAAARAGLWLSTSPAGTVAASTYHNRSPLGRPARTIKQPRFARGASGQYAAHRHSARHNGARHDGARHDGARYRGARYRGVCSLRPKTAKMSAGHRPFRRVRWLRRAGDRSTVWRIGSLRMGGYR